MTFLVAFGCKDGTHITAPALPIDAAAERLTADSNVQVTYDTKVIQITGGSFRMGTAKGERTEQPVHTVTVAAFEIDATEVTVATYRRCVDAGRCRPVPRGKTCSWSSTQHDDHPINCVSWFDADAYCKSVGKRLPTEEEWEYAARGAAGRTYPWGEAPVEQRACWKRWAEREGTCRIGSHASGDSPEGVHDMAGNVWEWTASAWSADYKSPRDGSRKVMRGGGWGDSLSENLRASSRGSRPTEHRSDTVGFRCVR